ncbi:MAG: hypothetical protein AAF304_08110 [Pseudomonadota bacterium]
MNNHLKIFCAFILLISISTLDAACNRDDIQFYLDKGFSQEQITQLCSASGTSEGAISVPDYTPYQQKVIIYKDGGGPEKKDGLTNEERTAFNDLKLGGDVTRLKLTPEHISYTAKVCLRAGQSPNQHERYKDCANIDYVIQRKDLIVTSSGKKLIFFGSAVVILEGTIQATPRRSFDSYPIEFRKALERDFNWKERGTKTSFPVRGDFSVTRTVNAFRALADSYTGSEGSSQLVEAETTATDEELPPEKPKKKKRWWNPFD